jgi:hypothetical protein
VWEPSVPAGGNEKRRGHLDHPSPDRDGFDGPAAYKAKVRQAMLQAWTNFILADSFSSIQGRADMSHV